MRTFWLYQFTALTLTTIPLNAQEAHPGGTAFPPQEAAHFEGVDQRGDKGMGFSHKMTGHHFHLLADGGAIEVEANNAKDEGSRKAIRDHMSSIAGMFSRGDFSLPMFIHATNPPGMETMKRLKDEIVYSAENTPLGAQVRISTKNLEAVKAVHDFLRFQIAEHRTNDSGAVMDCH
jgi:hypothetical protein